MPKRLLRGEKFNQTSNEYRNNDCDSEDLLGLSYEVFLMILKLKMNEKKVTRKIMINQIDFSEDSSSESC
jgi:uncharacterized protein YktA (UPF0223 family)